MAKHTITMVDPKTFQPITVEVPKGPPAAYICTSCMEVERDVACPVCASKPFVRISEDEWFRELPTDPEDRAESIEWLKTSAKGEREYYVSMVGRKEYVWLKNDHDVMFFKMKWG